MQSQHFSLCEELYGCRSRPQCPLSGSASVVATVQQSDDAQIIACPNFPVKSKRNFGSVWAFSDSRLRLELRQTSLDCNLGLPGGVNGSTRDFGSLCPGSNPGRAALSRFVPPATTRSCLRFSFAPWFCRSPDGSNFCSPDLHGSRTVTGSRESHAVSPSLHLPCSTPATRSVLRPSSLPATCPCSPTKSRLENLRIDIVNPRPNSLSSRSDTV
jgi:hypothetical protein